MKNYKAYRKFLILIPLLLTVFFAVNNFTWLKMNFQPPVDDEARHIGVSMHYLEIITDPSLDVLHRIAEADKLYPPFYLLLGTLFGLVFGINTVVLCMINVIFMFGIFLCLYLIGRKLGNPEAGVLACCLLSLYPMFFHISKMYMIETALVFMVAATILSLLYSDGFKNSKGAILSGLFLGFGLLTKQIYIIFVAAPAIWIFLNSFLKETGKKRRTVLINFILFSLIGILLALPWYAYNFAQRIEATRLAAFDQSFVPEEMPIFSAQSFFYYLRVLWKDQLFPVYFYLFIIALIVLIKNKRKECGIFLIWIIIPYFVLSLFPNKFYYYSISYLPAVAFISALGILEFKNSRYFRLLLVIIVLFGLRQFFHLSYFRPEKYSPVFSAQKYSPQPDVFYTKELFSDIGSNSQESGLIIGLYGMEGNELGKKGMVIRSSYILTNPDWMVLYCRKNKLPYEFISLKRKAAKVDFIISSETLDKIYLPHFNKSDYTIVNAYVLPDMSLVYLYKLSVPGPSAPMDQAGKEKNTEIANRNLRVALNNNVWEVFWKGKKITQFLSVYTSFHLTRNWCDSVQSGWEAIKLNEKEILALTFSKCAPVNQVWRIRLDGNRIYWDAEIRAVKRYKTNREQANIMLSQEYRQWVTSQGEGNFPEGFNRDYGGDWEALNTVVSGGENFVGAKGNGVDLPDVLFYCTNPGEGMVGNVINSDDFFKGRVLQYVVKHKKFRSVPRGKHEYFRGYFLFK